MKTTKEKLMEIKQSFRFVMNGVASRSMRDKGLVYKINWGVDIPTLKDMAKQYDNDFDLAVSLWKENIRECKILAAMIMPNNLFTKELAEEWIANTETKEIVEMSVFYLYRHLPYASAMAYEWINSSNDMQKIGGYMLLANTFGKGDKPNEQSFNDFIGKVSIDLRSENMSIKHSVMTCLTRFAELGDRYNTAANEILTSLNLPLLS